MSQPGFTPQSAVEGRYLLDAYIEGWGLGEAWQARDKNFRNRPVIVEFFPAAAADLTTERSHELRAQRTLKHSCVLAVINQGVHEGRPWVAFDSFDGAALPRFLDEQRRTRGQVARGAAQEIFGKVLDGVIAGHEAATPVLHGCVHPRCVIVKEGALKVTEFGLWRFVAGDTLAPFLAPELAKAGEAPSIASDVYALGALLAELLMPQNIGDARKALETLLASATRDGGAQAGRMQRNDIAGPVWDVIARAIKHEPAARWDHASSMRDALNAAWAVVPVAEPPRLRAPTPALPVAPPPMSAPMATQMPALPPLPPPVAAFAGPPPFVGVPMPPPSTAWDSPPPPSGASDAWATLKPSGQSAMKAALASAWDSPAPLPPIAPPAAVASAWDAGNVSPSWVPPVAYGQSTPVAGAVASGDDDWEDETRATEGAPRHTPAPIASSQAMQSRLAMMKQQESTMALDIESLGAPAKSFAPTPSRPPLDDDDDWKDSVVVLDTARVSATPNPFVTPDDDDPIEPGGRTHVAHASSPVLDSMETLRPMQRPMGVEAFAPRGSRPRDAESTFVANAPLIPGVAPRPPTMAPSLPAQMSPMRFEAPPVSERTMAIDMPGPPAIAQTLQAPMGLPGAPRVPAPFVPPPPPRAPSRAPIVIAVVVAVILIVGALAVVATRG